MGTEATVWIEAEWVGAFENIDDALAEAARHAWSRDADAELRDDEGHLIAVVSATRGAAQGASS